VRRVLIVVLFAMCFLGASWAVRAQDRTDFSQWDKAIAAFEQQDKEKPPPKHAVLFAGSSSIRLWDLNQSFPGLQAINRGFGGSQVVDSVYFARQLILKHQPRLLVFYAGDNDIAAGKSPERVTEDFQALVRAIHQELPRTKIIFLAIKPSLARWAHVGRQRRANALVENLCKTDDRLVYLDVASPMLGEDGKPRPELFAADGLHLNKKGYEMWSALLQPLLK
jgi:lysophospholipase L1-like esterase